MVELWVVPIYPLTAVVMIFALVDIPHELTSPALGNCIFALRANIVNIFPVWLIQDKNRERLVRRGEGGHLVNIVHHHINQGYLVAIVIFGVMFIIIVVYGLF